MVAGSVISLHQSTENETHFKISKSLRIHNKGEGLILKFKVNTRIAYFLRRMNSVRFLNSINAILNSESLSKRLLGEIRSK